MTCVEVALSPCTGRINKLFVDFVKLIACMNHFNIKLFHNWFQFTLIYFFKLTQKCFLTCFINIKLQCTLDYLRNRVAGHPKISNSADNPQN